MEIQEKIRNSIQDARNLYQKLILLVGKSGSSLLLQNNAKNRVVIAAWNGEIENGRLTYARTEHHEFRSYPMEKAGIIIDLNPSLGQ
jgi:hypothetical protein